jgi:hypothetical protein
MVIHVWMGFRDPLNLCNYENEMKAISYSLFGYDKEKHKDCFDFPSFLRYMHICVRFNRILFPGWKMIVNIDRQTYDSPFRPIFEWHQSKGFIRFDIQENAPLCKAMLWRLKTVFCYTHPEWEFTHVLNRDLDSVATFREAQMVHQWAQEDKAIHCITDSVSHTIPMMGGMIGFRPGYVNDLLKLNINPEAAWNKLLSLAPDIDYNRKGSDQDFLNRIIHPKCAHNATEHFILGMRHDVLEGNGRHYSLDETIMPEGVSAEIRDRLLEKKIAGHVGAAGSYEPATMHFLYHHDPYRLEYEEIESSKEFEKIFYWYYREDFR